MVPRIPVPPVSHRTTRTMAIHWITRGGINTNENDNQHLHEITAQVSNSVGSPAQIAMDAMDIIRLHNKKANELTLQLLEFRQQSEDEINRFMDRTNLLLAEMRSDE